MKLFQCFHIQMVVVPFLRNNPSAVMFFQRCIFSAKKIREKYYHVLKLTYPQQYLLCQAFFSQRL